MAEEEHVILQLLQVNTDFSIFQNTFDEKLFRRQKPVALGSHNGAIGAVIRCRRNEESWELSAKGDERRFERIESKVNPESCRSWCG